MAHNNEKLLRDMRRSGWVTVAEAARLATRSTSTIYYWARKRYVEAGRHGRTIFVSLKDVQEACNLAGGAK